MRSIATVFVVITSLSACSSSDPSVTTDETPDTAVAASSSETSSAGYTASLSANSPDISRETIAKCWTSVGFKGDLYKFMLPEEAAGLRSVKGGSKEQVEKFKACVQPA